MANKRAYKETFDEAFREDCTVINLATEYPGHEGTEKYLIATDLSEEELASRHGGVLERFRPYTVAGKGILEIFREFHNNEAKHRMRACRAEEQMIDEISRGKEYREPAEEDFADRAERELNEAMRKAEEDEAVRRAYMELTPEQRRRLWMRERYGATYDAIGRAEGIGGKCAEKSVKRAKTSLKKKYEENLEKIRREGVENGGADLISYEGTIFDAESEEPFEDLMKGRKDDEQ